MKTANILFVAASVLALGGCQTVKDSYNGVADAASDGYHGVRSVFVAPPGRSVQFVAGSASSVLIDYSSSKKDELSYADQMANEKCGLFGKQSAALESLNPREGEIMRATYVCN